VRKLSGSRSCGDARAFSNLSWNTIFKVPRRVAKVAVYRKALFRDRNQTIKRTLFTFERRPDTLPGVFHSVNRREFRLNAQNGPNLVLSNRTILTLSCRHPLLREMAKDWNSDVRASAVKGLASFSKEEALPLLRERALARDDEVAAEAVRGLASRYSREELEVILNGHDQELCAGALAALDELLYMPEWLKARDRLKYRYLLQLEEGQ
jgi:hypothetical protein